MAISFSCNGHQQAISQKLKKKASTYSANLSKLYGIPFRFMLIFIKSFNVINSLKMHYLQRDVSKFCYGWCEYI